MRVLLADILTWTLDNPWIPFMIFPLLIGSLMVSVWRENRKQQKLEANPIRMTDIEYKRFNNKRFSK